MSETSTAAAPSLVLRRTYPAPRQRVFDAWTKPEIAVKFFGPEDVKVPELSMDVRNGGTYRVTMLRPDGGRLVAKGTYREVRAPEFLQMTWIWEEEKPADERETLLTLEFNEVDGGTEIVLTHAMLANAESRDRHEHGWNAILNQLNGVL